MIDLLIAGGGPAGLVTALHARRSGLEVVVVEPRGTRLDKACGEGIMPAGLRALTELGVDVGGHRITGITYRDHRHEVHADFAHGSGRGVRRPQLSAALRSAAESAGVGFLEQRVRQVEQRGDRVCVDGMAARYLVGADGLHSTVRRSVDETSATTTTTTTTRFRRWGVRAHFQMEPWTDRVEVYWSGGGEAYVTPVGDRLVGVALLGARRGGFAERLSAFPDLARRLPRTPVTEPLGAGPLRQDVRTRARGRILLVGDAAGYVDALTGEGLSLAFGEAAAAVRAVASGRPERYEDEYRSITRSYRWLTTALVTATRHERIRRGVVPLAQRAPCVFRAAVRSISG